ncbi:MAG: hypothetical protein MUO57_16065, partial [Anaerolineales bacterium]|nr:hypothetical protein [Anaerolineales bacterium]
MDSSQEYKTKHTSTLASNKLLIGLVAAFLLAGVVTVWLTFSAVKDLVAAWDFTSPASLSLENPQDAGAVIPEDLGSQGEVPLQTAGGPPAVPWDGNSRISVLVMGL